MGDIRNVDWERRIRQGLRWHTRRISQGGRVIFQYENPKYPENWGDVVGGRIANHIAGRRLEVTTDPYVAGKILAVGSVVDMAMPGDIIWGAGCITAKGTGHAGRRLDVRAVRGPLSREAMHRAGYQVPAIYGDPALFFPELKPRKENRNVTARWGVIPHYTDMGHPVLSSWENDGAVIIDICSGVEDFIDQLLSVDRVVSSSLHGLIMSDAYGIPNARVSFHDLLFGGDFKFKDYASSVGREDWKAHRVTSSSPLSQLDKLPLNDKIFLDLEPLRGAAPFEVEG